MQYRLLDVLCCPSCKGKVEVESFETTKREPLDSGERKRCDERCAYVEAGFGKEADCRRCSEMEISAGLISCHCGRRYPIIDGVPRFLPEELQQEVVERFPQFYVKYEAKISQHLSKAQRDRVGELKAQTMSSFGYEWTEFSEYDAQNFLELIYPIQPEYFAGKLGLDCGCGAGRHTKQADRKSVV